MLYISSCSIALSSSPILLGVCTIPKCVTCWASTNQKCHANGPNAQQGISNNNCVMVPQDLHTHMALSRNWSCVAHLCSTLDSSDTTLSTRKYATLQVKVAQRFKHLSTSMRLKNRSTESLANRLSVLLLIWRMVPSQYYLDSSPAGNISEFAKKISRTQQFSAFQNPPFPTQAPTSLWTRHYGGNIHKGGKPACMGEKKIHGLWLIEDKKQLST